LPITQAKLCGNLADFVIAEFARLHEGKRTPHGTVRNAVGNRRKLGPAPQAGAKSSRFRCGGSMEETAILFERRFGRTDRTTINSRADYGSEKDAVEAPIAGENGKITFVWI